MLRRFRDFSFGSFWSGRRLNKYEETRSLRVETWSAAYLTDVVVVVGGGGGGGGSGGCGGVPVVRIELTCFCLIVFNVY